MSSISVLNDEQWLMLLEQVAGAFNEVTLNRGFTYFKQQHIASLSISEDRVVQAEVTGLEDCKVTLYPDKLKSSSCTCPAGPGCKHLAAVIMELADRLGYPASHIVNARHHLKRAASLASLEAMPMQLPSMDVFGWHEYFNRFTAFIQPSYNQDAYKIMLLQQLQSIRKDRISFSILDWLYFDMHKELFVLHKIKEQNKQDHYYGSFVLYRTYDEVQSWIYQKSTMYKSTFSEERLKQTLRYLRQQLAEENDHIYLDYGLYKALWQYWITPLPNAGDWAAREIEEIERQASDGMSTSLSAAKAFLHLQQGSSEKAWTALEASGTVHKAPSSLFLPFLEHLAQLSHWEQLFDWLLKAADNFYGRRSHELNAYMDYWKKTIKHMPEAEQQLWNLLERMLPHSNLMIQEMLYEQRKWKPWIEMQIVKGQDPLYHRVSVLQPIEKEAPNLLLPYYHQAIDHYVALKNRHDYKLAVKLLKRLQKVYKKMKLVERWDHFFAAFVERYSRLRALQEEMKKGKLLE